jgi:hypothetical protein
MFAACGGDNAPEDNSDDALKARARIAEVNLTRIRDAVVKYHGEHGEIPMSVTHLNGFGGGENELEPSDDYADIGYAFFNVKFEDGKMTQGWFIATPVAGSGALQVRMNGVTGEFDYVPQGEDFGRAPSDPPDNQPE